MCSAEVERLVPVFEKLAAEPKQNLLRCKNIDSIATFNVRILNTINQQPELTAFKVKRNIDIICLHEHRYNHIELKLKYQDTGNGWSFVLVSELEKSINVAIVGIGMLLGPPILKSGGARGVMVIVVGNGHGETSSNPGPS